MQFNFQGHADTFAHKPFFFGFDSRLPSTANTIFCFEHWKPEPALKTLGSAASFPQPAPDRNMGLAAELALCGTEGDTEHRVGGTVLNSKGRMAVQELEVLGNA